MVDELSNFAVEVWYNDVADLVIVVDEKLSDEELGVAALGKLGIGSLELCGNLFPLLRSRIFDCGLDGSDRVVLENEVADAASDDAVQFRNQLLSLLLGNMGLEAQSFPDLLCPLDFIG